MRSQTIHARRVVSSHFFPFAQRMILLNLCFFRFDVLATLHDVVGSVHEYVPLQFAVDDIAMSIA